MLVITMEVYGVSAGMELAVKEDLAMVVEKHYGGTVRVVSVEGREERDAKFKRISKTGQAI